MSAIPPNKAVNELLKSINEFNGPSLEGEVVDRVNKISRQTELFYQQPHSIDDALKLRVTLLEAENENPIPKTENLKAKLDKEINKEFGHEGVTPTHLNAIYNALSEIIRNVPPAKKIEVMKKFLSLNEKQLNAYSALPRGMQEFCFKFNLDDLEIFLDRDLYEQRSLYLNFPREIREKILAFEENQIEKFLTLEPDQQNKMIAFTPPELEVFKALNDDQQNKFLALDPSMRTCYSELSEDDERTAFLDLSGDMQKWCSNLLPEDRTAFLDLSEDVQKWCSNLLPEHRKSFFDLSDDNKYWCSTLHNPEHRIAFLAIAATSNNKQAANILSQLKFWSDLLDRDKKATFLALPSDQARSDFMHSFRA